MGQNCSRKDRPFGVSGDSAPLCTYMQTRALPLRFPLPCSHPTTTPPRRRCFCHIRLSAWSCPFLFEYYGQTFRSNSTRKCTDARRHNRNYRSLSLRLNREPPVPSEFSCAPRLDSTTSTSGGREEQAPSVSPSRDVNNPRDSRFFERRKEEDPVRRGGDRYYGAGVDWMDASLLKVDSTRAPRLNLNRACTSFHSPLRCPSRSPSLPFPFALSISFTLILILILLTVLPALDDGHRRFGEDEGSRVKEKIVVKGRDRQGALTQA
ncbi:hypothetical protein B0H13DRAFT_2261820 [Mycena leptocephala]|nr:hypothetical protein B0H13DRAFT_2261820 [Mycena leptocephala]